MNWTEIRNNSKEKRWLVTGGAGFIGSHLVHALCEFGAKVTVLDNLASGSIDAIRELISSNKVNFIQGDIRNPADCAAAMVDVDYVLHQAAMVSVVRSFEHPEEVMNVNVQGFANILSEAKRNKVKRVVYASSSAVYGELNNIPLAENCSLEPISIYGLSKKMNEELARQFYINFGLSTVGLRYFNVFGPRQATDSVYGAVIPNWLRAARSSGSFVVYGDGGQVRDFVYVKNVVYANLLAALTSNREAFGKVFNVGTGKGTSILSLLESIRVISKTINTPEFASSRPGDIKQSIADISEAKRVFGYEPLVDLANGLQETFSWYHV